MMEKVGANSPFVYVNRKIKQNGKQMQTLLLANLLMSCVGNQKTSATGSGDTGEVSSLIGLGGFLLGTYYVFESAEGFNPVAETTLNIHFKRSPQDDLRFEFNGGCNVFHGDPTFDETATMLMSEMFVSGTYNHCDWESMTQDDWLVGFFTNAPTLNLTPGAEDTSILHFDGTQASINLLQVEPPN